MASPTPATSPTLVLGRKRASRAPVRAYRRTIEIEKKNSNNLSRVCSFCNTGFNLTWQMLGVDGKGTYDTTKVIHHLNLDCTGV